MKKLLSIYLFTITVFTVNSQTLNGSCYDNGQATSSWFTQVDLNATFSFYAKNNLVYIRCSNLKMNVPSNTTYNAYGKTYTKSDLGISQWPQNQKPWSMTIYVSGSYNGGSFNKSIFCNSSFTCDEFHIEGITAGNVNIGSFKVNSISNFTYNQGGDAQLEELIKQKNKQQSLTTNSSTSVSNNPLTTSQTSITQTNSQIPSLESQYAKLGIPANTPTYSKKEVTNQLVIQAGSLAGELINEYNANYDKKMARWQAESDANSAALRAKDKKKTEVKFKAEFLPLIPQAFKGDDNARMALYYASRELDCYDYVSLKQREEWLKQALANNNLNAILENSISLGYHGPESISALEKAANLGSLDAMMILASWYNMKTYKTYGVTFIGGDNPQKAIEWFTKGALSGCPVSMYHLGMIYKYGKTKTVRGHEKKGMVIYGKEIINEKLAFEWFSKSIQYPTFKKSLFARSLQTHYWFLSEFDPRAYDELAKMYTEGKVVPKDQAKSIALKTEASNWSELKENEDIREMKRYN